ncbi:putative orfan [Tupanvirus soda lake]|uniref:Orfan n=2 Tax=Tupanvirus TaxID=2094720 RepID=A0AC62ACK7_9VIRU|nr:putative orfan [Tupanvirus soda lake]QKU35353.1 putative orfan [Tupanvirus soda lake]
MITFRGIFNDNGREKLIRIYLDLEATGPYTTDFYIDNIRTDARIDKNICKIQNVEYQYTIKNFQDEIILAAKEIDNLLHLIFPCFYKQKFFVVSNKEEV